MDHNFKVGDRVRTIADTELWEGNEEKIPAGSTGIIEYVANFIRVLWDEEHHELRNWCVLPCEIELIDAV